MQGTSIAGTVILYFQSSTGVFSGVESLYSVLCKKYTFGIIGIILYGTYMSYTYVCISVMYYNVLRVPDLQVI
ncbi:hypothetical protein HAV15_001199 [Penicillium sp. str. |nr:hypothetical protein HAV15_001199 [Penicillium sp. str. \